MKGSINKGIRDMVVRNYGEGAWSQIKDKVGLVEDLFFPALDYPDALTFELVSAASEVLGKPRDAILYEFGKWWVLETDRESYPAFFQLAGKNVKAFIRNIDRIHDEITRNIPGAYPPHFEYEDLPDGRLAMHYYSGRMLTPVVKGSLQGAALHFREEIEVEEAPPGAPGACATILIRFR